MTKGVRTALTDETRADLVADYLAGVGINALRTKYGCGQGRVIAIVEGAGVRRRIHPRAAETKRGVPRRDVVERAACLGRQPTEEEWAYLAGIFDAEGYLGYASRGRYYRLTITQNAGQGLHERLVALLGAGRISGPPPGQPTGIAQFHLETQRQIFAFCRGVLPFVIVKRPRVLDVLTACQEKYGWHL
jgi:hypothetical protein